MKRLPSPEDKCDHVTGLLSEGRRLSEAINDLLDALCGTVSSGFLGSLFAGVLLADGMGVTELSLNLLSCYRFLQPALK